MDITEDELLAIYNKAFTYYISPKRFEDMDNKGWRFEPFPFGPSRLEVMKRLLELLKWEYKVKCGYMATSVRNYKNYYIIYKS